MAECPAEHDIGEIVVRRVSMPYTLPSRTQTRKRAHSRAHALTTVQQCGRIGVAHFTSVQRSSATNPIADQTLQTAEAVRRRLRQCKVAKAFRLPNRTLIARFIG